MKPVRSKETGYKKWASTFRFVVIAGCLSFIFRYLIKKTSWPVIYQYVLLDIIAIPFAMYIAFGLKKGFQQLERPDYLICIAGAIGGVIVEIIIYFFDRLKSLSKF